MAMTTDPDVYFLKGCGRCVRFDTPDCSTRQWANGLAALRSIMQDMGLEETAKWGHPCYMHAGRNIALLGAFRDDYRINFMNPTLLRDTEGVLETGGPNTATAGMLRFVSNDAVAPLETVIRGYLRQLMDHAEAGTKPPKVVKEVEMPDELAEALDSDPELAEAFSALTPGRQRSYLVNLNSAKQSATRIARIVKFRDNIMAGKGALER
jgi:uncharacterized protein YdeI (YjbR/CyaY-like superfamily)